MTDKSGLKTGVISLVSNVEWLRTFMLYVVGLSGYIIAVYVLWAEDRREHKAIEHLGTILERQAENTEALTQILAKRLEQAGEERELKRQTVDAIKELAESNRRRCEDDDE